jgi:hypothetical protein
MSGTQFTFKEFDALSLDQIKLLKPDKLQALFLTRQDVYDMNGDKLRALVDLGPLGKKAIEDGYMRVPPTEEEIAAADAQKDAAKAAADQTAALAAKADEDAKLAAEAERLARQQLLAQEAERRKAAVAAEDAELAASGITAERDASGNVVKLVQEYQVLDEQNRPIGRPTHLEARTWPELSRKQREAHTQAARAFQRVKDQKLTFQKKQETSQQNQDAEMAQAIQDLNSTDPAKKLAAIRKIAASDPAADQAKREAEAARQSYVFRSRHVQDFNGCAANVGLLTQYIQENELEWTADNLELAFDALQAQLAPVEVPRAAATYVPNPAPVVPAVSVPAPVIPAPVSANPAPPVVPAVPAVPAPALTPAAQPAPVAVPVPVNPVPEPQRPSFHGGLVPGESLSGSRPHSSTVQLTKREIRSWTPAQMREAMNDPVLCKQMEALGIQVLQGTWEQIRERGRQR